MLAADLAGKKPEQIAKKKRTADVMVIVHKSIDGYPSQLGRVICAIKCTTNSENKIPAIPPIETMTKVSVNINDKILFN